MAVSGGIDYWLHLWRYEYNQIWARTEWHDADARTVYAGLFSNLRVGQVSSEYVTKC